MPDAPRRFFVSIAALLMLVAGLNTALAQAPHFSPDNLVVLAEGCGVHGGTCTSVPNGTGTGTGNSAAGGYGDNQAGPLTLFQYTPNGSASVPTSCRRGLGQWRGFCRPLACRQPLHSW